MYFCVFNKIGQKKIGEIQSGNENQLTAHSILNQYDPDSNTLWMKTERYAYACKDDDLPFVDHPDLLVSSRPDNFVPETVFFASSDFDSTSKFLYFLPKHDTNQKIPRLVIYVSESNLQSDLNKLSTIIEKSFISPANVKEILINDQPANGDYKINDVFEDAKNGKEISVSLSFDEVCMNKIRLRENLCNEIVYSENNFINDLTVINTDWKKMFEEENFLAETDFKTLFNDIPMILGIHTKFGQYLKKNLDGYGSIFSECFIEYHPFFKGSTNYITNYPNINEILKVKEEQQDFQDKCKEVAENHKGRDLASYLITPVQRIPRYLLFLRELIKLTPQNHPDFYYLSFASEIMKNLTKEIDKKTETAEKQNILYNIQLRNYTNFVYCQPARKVTKVYNTIIKDKNLEGNLVVCDDYVFLIDKLDMYCRFKAPLNAFPAEFLNDGESFRVLNTDEPDNLVETTVHMYSKEDLEEFKKMIQDASLKGFNSATENDESLLWEVSPISDKTIPLCKHSGVYVKNKDEEYYLFYGGYTIKSQEQDEADPDAKKITYERNNKIYCFTLPDQFKEIDSGIPGRYSHKLIYSNNKFFIIGGAPSSENIYVYDNNQEGDQLGWKKVKAPELDLTGHSVVQYKNYLYIYGGSQFKDDVYELNTDDYNIKTYDDFPEDQKPEARTNHSAVVYNNKFYVFGGTNYAGQPLSDMWSFDLETKKWEKKGQFCIPKSGHQGILLGNEYVIIGGKPKGDSFSINLETFQKKAVNDYGNYPAGLNGFVVAVDNNNNILVYGGAESTSKTPKNTVYTVKLNDSWNQRVSEEEKKNAELVNEKSQQDEMKSIVTTYRGLDLDGAEQESNEDVFDVGESTSGLLESAGPGDGDAEPWTLTPQEADELIKKLQEKENNPEPEEPNVISKDVDADNQKGEEQPNNGDDAPWIVSPDDQAANAAASTTPKDEPENQQPADEAADSKEPENKPSTGAEEITNGDEAPWTLSLEEAEEALNRKEEDKKEEEHKDQTESTAQTPETPEEGGNQQQEEQQEREEQIENADQPQEGAEGITDGDKMPWTLSPEEAEEALNRKEEENNQEQPNENNEEEIIDNQDWVVEEDKLDDLLNKNDEEDIGNNFEVDQSKDLNKGEEEEGGNQFEPDDNLLLIEEEEENQFEPDKDDGNENINGEEENKKGGNEEEGGDNAENDLLINNEEESNENNQNQNKEEEENHFEPSNSNQNNEEEGENQAIIEEEEEESIEPNQNDEDKIDHDNDQQQNGPGNEAKDDKNNGNQDDYKKTPPKKYSFHFEYKPSDNEEEEDDDESQYELPKKKPEEWPFEKQDDPPRKFSPIFYPETPGSRRRKKNQSKKKSNSQMSPTGGASGKPPIFNVSSNYDYFNNYNNANNNNNSFNNYSFNNTGSYSPLSPKRRPSSPKASLYPNVVDDVTPQKKYREFQRQQYEQRQKQLREQNDENNNNSSQYTSSVSSSSVTSPNRQNQVQDNRRPTRQQQKPQRQPQRRQQTTQNKKLSQSRNVSKRQQQQQQQQQPQPLDQNSSSTVQSSSLLNSSSEKIEDVRQQQSPSKRQQQQQQQLRKTKLELSPVSAKETPPSEQGKITTKSLKQQEEEELISAQTETDVGTEADLPPSLPSKQQPKVSDNEEENDEVKLDATTEEEEKDGEKKSKKDKDKKKDKKEKDKDKKEKDKNDKDKKEKDKKDKDKKDKDKKDKDRKDKDKKKDTKKKDNIEDDKEKVDKKKSKKKYDEKESDRKHHYHHNHKSDHSQDSSKGHSYHRNRYDDNEDKINRRDQQSRSDINNMTKTNDTMPLMFDTSPIKKPNQETRNINAPQQPTTTSTTTNNNRNYNNYNYEPGTRNLRSKGAPYHFDNNNDDKEKIIRRKRFNHNNSNDNFLDDDSEFNNSSNNSSSNNNHHRHHDALTFKRKPTFKRTAQNHFKFNGGAHNDFESSDLSESGAHFGGFDQFEPLENDGTDNNNNYFNFRLRGIGNTNFTSTNVASSNSPYYTRFNRPKYAFMNNFNVPTEQINCSYLPKFNIYGQRNNFNNNYNANNLNYNNIYGGGVGTGYKPTDYRRNHAKVNANARYNVIDDTFELSSNSNNF